MNRIRFTLTALALTAAGIAQAQEISERPAAVSLKARTLVAAEARTATPTNEIWDGREAKAAPMATVKSRAEVRAEVAKALPSDMVGGS